MDTLNLLLSLGASAGTFAAFLAIAALMRRANYVATPLGDAATVAVALIFVCLFVLVFAWLTIAMLPAFADPLIAFAAAALAYGAGILATWSAIRAFAKTHAPRPVVTP